MGLVGDWKREIGKEIRKKLGLPLDLLYKKLVLCCIRS